MLKVYSAVSVTTTTVIQKITLGNNPYKLYIYVQGLMLMHTIVDPTAPD